MARIRILVVDDSASTRRAISDLLSEDPGIEIVATAVDPFEAAAKMRDVLPDVILLDVELPRMDGITFLGKIMSQKPIPVVICSSHTEAGSRAALRALELGAAEVIAKPRLGTREAWQEAQIVLGDAIRAAAQSKRARGDGRSAGKLPVPKPAPFQPGPKLTADAILPLPRSGGVGPRDMPPLIALGASTGGTQALAEILPQLPERTAPVVIVQHMPGKFTAAFANRLNGLCNVTVREAADGDRPEAGKVLIAPGDSHVVLHRQGKGYRIALVQGPYVARHRPSVDVLFRSAAIAAGPAALGVLMTGMGDDGARGLLEMKEAGAETVVQDEATSVVWGMPGEAYRLGAATRAVPLARLPLELQRFGTQVRSP